MCINRFVNIRILEKELHFYVVDKHVPLFLFWTPSYCCFAFVICEFVFAVQRVLPSTVKGNVCNEQEF